jgi:3-hydroxybutyryl-CoA dehydrogenase
VAIDLSKPDLIVAVFGAGTMGRGIAQVSAQAGLTTLLFDSTDGAVKTAIAAIDRGLEGLVAKERMTAAAKQDVLNRLNSINSLDEAKGAGIVIQARAVPRVGETPVRGCCARHQYVVAVGH